MPGRWLRTPLRGVAVLMVGALLCIFALLNEAAPVDEAVPSDTCLTCHVEGPEHLVWMPTGRWLVFGAAVAVLIFGMWRSVSVYRRRERWVTLCERVIRYLDDRFQTVAPLRKALDRPALEWSRRWFYYLGGLTLVAFAVQAVTGVMLAFNYRPSAEINPVTGQSYAYESILYIMREVQLGALVRTIHHWAANLMIVLCVAHMARVFIVGAYRRPRELTWVAGMVLLVLTLAFAFTGYLLPWDQTAFWAATVGTAIVGNLPAVGEPAMIFLRDGWAVTGQTLNRFYGLHVFALPALTFVVMGLHLWMVRRLGTARPLLAWAVVLAIIVGSAVLTAVLPLELAAPADPLNPPAHPRPEWYFLFLFEFLRYVPGELRIGATTVMTLGPVCGATTPVLALILLSLLPFLDRRRQDSARAQRIRLAGAIAGFVIFLALTILGARGG